ncbi:MAG TPA: sulfite exporter TauE/SafE family protein [Polyangia bacterium]
MSLHALLTAADVSPVMPAGLATVVLIFLAGVGAGMINSVAGGGTLLSFPVLLSLGRDPVLANVANAVALSPGSLAAAYAYRRELRAAPRLLAVLLPASIVGSVAGAYLLLATPARWFDLIVPVLILAATALLALKRPLLRVFGAFRSPKPGAVAPALPEPTPANPPAALWGLAFGQLLVGIYGGYFGAAIGIIMLATLGLAGVGDIHQRNALKNACSAAINAIAGLFFATQGAVLWFDACVLAAGAITGGYLGGLVGRRLNQRLAEGLVVAVGLIAAAAQIFRLR